MGNDEPEPAYWVAGVGISIHAPRMGSDVFVPDAEGFAAISIHAPRMGSDSCMMWMACTTSEFQSTLPGWGATASGLYADTLRLAISIHAPRVGSDETPVIRKWITGVFQSTLPGWGATLTTPENPRAVIVFQSTLPGWGATSFTRKVILSLVFQSTLPGWGATQ